MPTPKKRSAVTLDKKKETIEAAATNNNKSELAKNFNIPRTTIRDILNDKEAILEAIDGGGSGKRARLKSGKNEEIEEALLVRIKQVLSEYELITGELIQVSF